MRQKLYVLSFLLFLSHFAFGQTYFTVNYTLKFSDTIDAEEFNDIHFYCIKSKTIVEDILLNIENKEVYFSYRSMGNNPILILQKNEKKMYLFLSHSKWENNITDLKFEEGFFYIDDLKLVKYSNEKALEWNYDKDEQNLNLIILKN